MLDRTEFKRRLAERPLLLDGAMGTLLHSKGAAIDQCFDVINLTGPATVAEIHRAYIEAGADIIETNSFGANRFQLSEYALQNQVIEINQAAVTVARRTIDSAFKPVLLAGSIGPLGVRLAPLGRVTVSEAKEAFVEQISALVNAQPQGVDLLIIETMSDPKETETAVEAARTVSPDIPIVAQMTFTRDDRTLLGYTPDAVAQRLAKLDVDAIGINCSGGPAQVLRLTRLMQQIVPHMPIAASPNAGYPEQVDGGRTHYSATPDYFAQYATALTQAGAQLVGGCCGTTDAHIAAMRQAIDHPQPSTIPMPTVQIVTPEVGEETAVVDPPT